MMEGLAGIEDVGVCFDRVRLSPRWAVGGVKSAEISACYPASGASFSYRYAADSRSVRVACHGSGERLSVHLLLGDGARPGRVTWNGVPVEFSLSTVEESTYVDLSPPGQCGDLEVIGSPA